MGKLLHRRNDRTDADHDAQIKFALRGVDYALRDLLERLGIGASAKLLHKHDVGFVHAYNVVVSFFGEHILDDVVGDDLGIVHEADQHNDAVDLAVETQLLGFYVYVAGENIVENDVFDEIRFVEFLVVKRFDVGHRNGKHGGNALRHFVAAFDEDDVFYARSRADGAVGVIARSKRIAGIGDVFDYARVFTTHVLDLAAGNDDALFVKYTDLSVDRIPHLVHHALKQFVAHFLSPILTAI